MPAEAVLISGIPAVLPLAVRTAQIGFELHQAPREIDDLLKTVATARKDIARAQKRRIVLAERGSPNLEDYDEAISQVEQAVDDLELLAERARVDREHNDRKLRITTRLLWYLRDAGSRSGAYDRFMLAYVRPPFVALIQVEEEFQECGRQAAREDVPPPYVAHHESTKKTLADLRSGGPQRMLTPEPSGADLNRSCHNLSTPPAQPFYNIQPSSPVFSHNFNPYANNPAPVVQSEPSLPLTAIPCEQPPPPERASSSPVLLHGRPREGLSLRQKPLAQQMFAKAEASRAQTYSTSAFMHDSSQQSFLRRQPPANIPSNVPRQTRSASTPQDTTNRGPEPQRCREQTPQRAPTNQPRTRQSHRHRQERSASDPDELFLPRDTATSITSPTRTRTAADRTRTHPGARQNSSAHTAAQTQYEPQHLTAEHRSQRTRRHHNQAPQYHAQHIPPNSVYRQPSAEDEPSEMPYEVEELEDRWWSDDSRDGGRH